MKKKSNNIKIDIMKNKIFIMIVSVLAITFSCSEFEKFELPESGSIEDATPPNASFSGFPEEGFEEQFRNYTFSNTSTSATIYDWDFGDGAGSSEFEPMHTFAAEGTYTVTLTATDALGVSDTSVQEIEVVRPEPPAVLDPVLVNTVFDRLPKSSGSDCTCSGWINRGLGDQGESSSGNGSDLVKFDNQEPDHVYQEFEVVPNADYLVTMDIRFSAVSGGTTESDLEFRILAGSGYDAGYVPVYYTDTALMPQGNSSTGLWGYTSVAQMEDPANNLHIQVYSTPGDDSYATYAFGFNSGANTSVAIFARGINGPSSGNYGYNSADAEIRMDNLVITANN